MSFRGEKGQFMSFCLIIISIKINELVVEMLLFLHKELRIKEEQCINLKYHMSGLIAARKV
jgi:predicted DNA-binding transcriptional regulator